MISENIKLTRSKEDEEKYKQRLKEVGSWGVDPFSDAGIMRLSREYGVEMVENSATATAFKNQFPYEGSKAHYVIVVTNKAGHEDVAIANTIAARIIRGESRKDYILMKKKAQSVDHAHWHLLFY